ncbi:unnamed protein product [Darwinula stevensoni]|uniref:Uncharacterized protein n=1 Tax=Darwinula stevensoni TaxID=69355 RepID=A0A7R9A696_9CRUS|nr:unnamed protein product [Darwinula stevensoni]CAG0887115.1 unnamed protein product [Darwinula stevensoni]
MNSEWLFFDPVTTIVLHDSMETKEVDRCSHPGCHGRKVTYESSLKQIVSLMDQSESCEQQMIYGCFSAGGKNDEMPHSWWLDRHGRPQHDWNGANAGEHTCNCGLHGDCADRWSPDAEAPGWESDTGVIADVAALPVTEIRGLEKNFKVFTSIRAMREHSCRRRRGGWTLPSSLLPSRGRFSPRVPGSGAYEERFSLLRHVLSDTTPRVSSNRSARLSFRNVVHPPTDSIVSSLLLLPPRKFSGDVFRKEGRELLCTVRKARPLPPSSGLMKNFKVFTSIRAMREHLDTQMEIINKQTLSGHRLPKTVVPKVYKVSLRPDLQNFLFDGSVEIAVQVSITIIINSTGPGRLIIP